MSNQTVVIPRQDNSTNAWINGLIGVVIFSASLPATRIAVVDLPPLFLTVARAAIAGLMALGAILFFNEKRPTKQQLWPLTLVAIGVVVGFPLLSALALKYITSAHSIVFVAILPLSTALFGVLRGGERPPAAFWFFAVLGSLLVIGFAFSQGITASPIGDILMLSAVIVCGLGYAEGAQLSKVMGGWQVISWALVISLPVMVPLTLFFLPDSLASVGAPAWGALAYVSVFSMFVGFIFWYRGLAQGGIASVGQLQLLQPLFGLALAATLLHEQVGIGMLAVTIGVILCVFGSKRYSAKKK